MNWTGWTEPHGPGGTFCARVGPWELWVTLDDDGWASRVYVAGRDTLFSQRRSSESDAKRAAVAYVAERVRVAVAELAAVLPGERKP